MPQLEGKNDQKTREFYAITMVLLLVPLALLWTTYIALTVGMFEPAVKLGLNGLISALYVFILVIVYTAKRLSPK